MVKIALQFLPFLTICALQSTPQIYLVLSQFTEIALGFPLQFLTLSSLTSWILRALVQTKTTEKLNQFMKDHEY